MICNISFYYACTIGPGTITQQNVQNYLHQPFDGLMFPNNNLHCKTCRVIKPARSKHCAMYGPNPTPTPIPNPNPTPNPNPNPIYAL